MQPNAHEPQLVLDERVELLEDDERVHLGREVGDEAAGERIDHAEFEGACVGEDLAGVGVRDAAGDDADRRATHFHPVQGEGLGKVGKSLDPVFNHGAAGSGVGRCHVVLREIAYVRVGDRSTQPDFADLNRRTGVTHPSGRAQQDGGVEPLGQVEGGDHEVVAVLAVGRVEAGDPGPTSQEAVVLLVLR